MFGVVGVPVWELFSRRGRLQQGWGCLMEPIYSGNWQNKSYLHIEFHSFHAAKLPPPVKSFIKFADWRITGIWDTKTEKIKQWMCQLKPLPAGFNAAAAAVASSTMNMLAQSQKYRCHRHKRIIFSSNSNDFCFFLTFSFRFSMCARLLQEQCGQWHVWEVPVWQFHSEEWLLHTTLDRVLAVRLWNEQVQNIQRQNTPALLLHTLKPKVSDPNTFCFLSFFGLFFDKSARVGFLSS